MGRTVDEHKAALFAKHPEVRDEYERLGPRYEAISELIAAREGENLTQAQLAERMGVSQSVVARLESGEHSPRLDTLVAAARAMGRTLAVEFKAPLRGRRRVATAGRAAVGQFVPRTARVSARSARDTYRYHFIVDGKIAHRGITSSVDRRERELKRRYGAGRARVVGKAVTRESAKRWAKEQPAASASPRGSRQK